MPRAFWSIPAFLAVAACAASLGARAAEAPRYYESEEPAAEIAPPGRGPSETVLARPRPDYDPIGIPLAGFRLHPQAVVSTGYDSNIFRTDSNTKSDLITVLRPRVQLRSDFNQHRLDLTAETAAGFYLDHDSENFLDYRADARGHVDILRGLRLEAALSGEHGHEDRGSVDFQAGKEPTEFDRFAALAVLAARTGAFRYRLGVGGTRLNYHDVGAIGGGTINNDDRDHVQTDIFGRVSAAVSPSFRLFASSAYNVRSFDASVDDAGIYRDSQGLTLVGGVEYDGGGLWFARGYGGWREQSYDDASLDDVSGGVFGGQVTANVTPLTTLTAEADRDLVDTATTGASSYWDTRAQVRADHEFLRNVIVSGALRGRRNDFRGIDRTDRYVGGGVGFRWLANRHLWLNLDFDLDQRTSSGSQQTQDFKHNRVFLRVVVQP